MRQLKARFRPGRTPALRGRRYRVGRFQEAYAVVVIVILIMASMTSIPLLFLLLLLLRPSVFFCIFFRFTVTGGVRRLLFAEHAGLLQFARRGLIGLRQWSQRGPNLPSWRGRQRQRRAIQ